MGLLVRTCGQGSHVVTLWVSDHFWFHGVLSLFEVMEYYTRPLVVCRQFSSIYIYRAIITYKELITIYCFV